MKLYDKVMSEIQYFTPKYFGLGFIQIKIAEDVRYHIWHPDLNPIVPEDEIHNHRYDFTSEIISGEIHQEVFYCNTGTQYQLFKVSCDPNNPMDILMGDYDMISVGKQTFRANSSYYLPRYMYHTVKANKAITKLTRGQTLDEYAMVARKPNMPHVCAFSEQIKEDILWDYIKDILND